MKILKNAILNKGNLLLLFEDFSILTVENPDINYINKCSEYIKSKKDFSDLIPKTENYWNIINLDNSKILYLKWSKIFFIDKNTYGELSVPKEIVEKILEYENTNENELNKYLNFWKLLIRNPNSQCRENLLWFLNKNNMKITPKGLIVAYRSVVKKEEKINYLTNQKEEVFTDNYSKTTTIILGKPVEMKREDTNENQENICSEGLHAACLDWISEKTCFGDIHIAVLINPADVVAVPPEDNYGKLRCCKYYPYKKLEDFSKHIDIDSFIDNNISIDIENIYNINNEEITQKKVISEKEDTYEL